MVLTYNIKSAFLYKNSLTKNTWIDIELPLNYIKHNIIKAKSSNLSVYQISPNITLSFQLSKKIYLSLNTNYTVSKYNPKNGFFMERTVVYGCKTILGYDINNRNGLKLSFSYNNNKNYMYYPGNYNKYYTSDIELKYHVIW